ncbi:hypothetical protein Hdeb2414_s0029g00706961 [Helianthus debilis subsp. tardiflorus]
MSQLYLPNPLLLQLTHNVLPKRILRTHTFSCPMRCARYESLDVEWKGYNFHDSKNLLYFVFS